MAKSLQERIASARSTDRVTIETLEKLISDAAAESERLSDAHKRASADSIDFALTEEDRDEAARNAEKYGRTVKAIATALDDLQEKLVDKRESDARKSAQAEQAAAIAERDALAAEFKEFVPRVVEQIIGLFSRVESNAKRMDAAGVREADAEAVARDLPRFLGVGGEALRFTKMKIPQFDGRERAWPIDHARAMQLRIAEQDQARAKRAAYLRSPEYKAEQARIAKAAAAEHTRLHGQYQLSTPVTDQTLHLPHELHGQHRLPGAIRYPDIWEGELPHEVARKLETVEFLNVKLLQPEATE